MTARLVIVTARLVIVPTGQTGPEGRPTCAIETTCMHATLATQYEAQTSTFTPVERGRLIGSASQLHDETLPCDCFKDGARVRVGAPEDWLADGGGIGPQHHRWADA